MTRTLSFILLCVLLLWLPLWLSWLGIVAYVLRFGGLEIVAFAVLLDWYLQPTWPYLSLLATVLWLILPVVQQRLMFYTT